MDAAAAVDLCRTTLLVRRDHCRTDADHRDGRRSGGRLDAGVDADPGSNGGVCAKDPCHGGSSGRLLALAGDSNG